MLTYTVRPMAQYIPCKDNPFLREVVSGGCNVTVREGDRVVHQFPRLPNERVGHRLAQLFIKNRNAK